LSRSPGSGAIELAGVLGAAAAAVAEHADAERVVDDHHRVVALGEIADRCEIGDPPGERVHTVGDDRAEPRPPRSAQDVLEVVGVVAAKRHQTCAGEPRALGEAGMHAAVADDAVLGAEQRREDADVGVIARAVQDDIGHLEEAAQPVLELLVDRQRAAHDPLRRQPDPVLLQRLDRGLLELRIDR
jgi:hypothetical protein